MSSFTNRRFLTRKYKSSIYSDYSQPAVKIINLYIEFSSIADDLCIILQTTYLDC